MTHLMSHAQYTWFSWQVYFAGSLRDAVKNYLADFFLLRGGGRGYPPIPLSFFGTNDFLLRGVGVPPISTKVFFGK